ncbi:MAG: ABC transporter permease [Candidatus Tectomicrobia bacterium]|nr:ABC transporter permease [Candidatus Tectomicrobia bacterium]
MTDTPVVHAPRHSLARDFWRQFWRHKGALGGAAVFVLIMVAVLLGPPVHGVDPQFLDYKAKNQGMSLDHPLGTDNLGRDTLARVLAGGRLSLAVGVAAMVLSLSLGTGIGVLAGFSVRLDGPLMRLTDLFLALPVLPLLLVAIMLFRDSLRSAIGPEVGIFVLIVAVIGITSWMQTARIVRGEVLAVKQTEFVLAARAVGTGPYRIMARHLLPNALSPITVSATLGVAQAVITESALSFLGLGFPSDFPTWGRLLYDGVPFLGLAPSRAIWPGLAISLTVLSINYMGDGLRDAMDPRTRRR